ncbi:hypothetical protein PI124_g451 [Phytophthora idaei]|nr:hypothetical protein PI126_g494 [Phytophthora idaei]KAG3254961.1 hypothetical protein PI124_g451 [Phytophthora idaei]
MAALLRRFVCLAMVLNLSAHAYVHIGELVNVCHRIVFQQFLRNLC